MYFKFLNNGKSLYWNKKNVFAVLKKFTRNNIVDVPEFRAHFHFRQFIKICFVTKKKIKIKERSPNKDKSDPLSPPREVGMGINEKFERITVSSLCFKSDEYVYFQTLKEVIIGKNENINVCILLESASQRTFINKNLYMNR